jgi:glyoxylase-like metal-dependent hydrolase (beta-lactamase superfamily II)
MNVKLFIKNDMGQNVYLYYDKDLGEGVLIDAGCGDADMRALAKYTEENNITVKAILLTHGHYDHIAGADAVKALTHAPLYCHAAEEEMLKNPALNLSTLREIHVSTTAEHVLNDGDTFPAGGATLRVLHTPGHTPGGVCYYDEANGVLFTGDTLFNKSIGRTDFPGGDHEELIHNIKQKLLTLPEETKVYPGHGMRTTIAYEKANNGFLV